MMRYDPTQNNYFTVHEAAKPVKLENPFDDPPYDISDWAVGVSDIGIPIVKSNVVQQEEQTQQQPTATFNSNPEYEGVPVQEEQEVKPNSQSISVQNNNKFNIKVKGSETLNKLMDEISNEPGYEKLRDNNIRNLLILQAKRESNFNYKATSSSSTAAGYFQFIDGTRRRYSSVSRNQFINDPKEQIRTAYKYLMDIHSMPDAKELKKKGYNDALITALGWWYPKSMRMVLSGKRDFSLGGYSIRKAFKDYG